MSATLRAVIALGLGGLAVALGLAQYGAARRASRRGTSYSFAPFVGAVLGTAACLLAPWRGSLWLLPFAFVLDPTPAMFLWAVATGAFRTNPPR